MLQFRIILCLAFATVCQSGNTTWGDTVVVELQSGQRLRAHSIERDPQTPNLAILTVGSERIQIRRAVSWNRVKRIVAPPAMLGDLQIPGNVTVVDSTNQERGREVNLTLTPDQAEQNAAQLRSFFRFPPPGPIPDLPSPEFFGDGPAVPTGGLTPPRSEEMTAPGGMPCCIIDSVPCGFIPFGGIFRDPGVVVGIRNTDPYAPPLAENAVVQQLPQARELIVSARAFNRNGLADWNSLEVMVQGRTAAGQSCPVRGSLKCTLWGRRARLVRAYGETFFEDPRELAILGQWSQFLDGTEMDANGVQKVVLALPPQSADQNLRVGQYGMLSVVLDIPGQGRLATSTDAIPMRQGGPNRSRSIVDWGSSILPPESVSEGTNNAGDWPAPLSDQRPDLRRFTVQP